MGGGGGEGSSRNFFTLPLSLSLVLCHSELQTTPTWLSHSGGKLPVAREASFRVFDSRRKIPIPADVRDSTCCSLAQLRSRYHANPRLPPKDLGRVLITRDALAETRVRHVAREPEICLTFSVRISEIFAACLTCYDARQYFSIFLVRILFIPPWFLSFCHYLEEWKKNYAWSHINKLFTWVFI